MTAAASAPSGLIQGFSPYRNTAARPWVQCPACAQIARLSWIVIFAPAKSLRRFFAGSASFAPEKPFFLWVPSQNGLLAEPPQRHNATVGWVASFSPFEFERSASPFTR